MQLAHNESTNGLSYGVRTNFEISMLKSLTNDVHSWLDVSCGTGFYLDNGRANDDILCTGIDMSLPMLEKAANCVPPLSKLICGNFMEADAARQSHYDLVTLLGFVYAMQDSEYDINILIRNLYLWTKPGGVCFVSILDPASDNHVQLPARGEHEKIGFLDDYGEWYSTRTVSTEGMNLVTPPVQWMLGLFKSMFKNVKLIDYPAEYAMIKGILATKPGGIHL